jgi:hypothetical protein
MNLAGLPLLPGLLFLLLSEPPIPPSPPVMFRGRPGAHRRRGRSPVRRPGRRALAGADGRRGSGYVQLWGFGATVERLPMIQAAAEYGLVRR